MKLGTITNRDIVLLRPPRSPVNLWQPNGMFVEPEIARSGRLEDVATILLSGRECPFRCLMCDLWKNTQTDPTPLGAIPAQIDYALQRLDPAQHVKLYNSGNFFDAAAIPTQDHEAIAEMLAPFRTVIIENHPKLCGPHCKEFLSRISPAQLEVAMGLETAHEATLQLLNKQMTRDDFRRAADAMRDDGIFVRAFILLRPPAMSEEQGIEWALRSLDFAFDAGADVCSVIATRSGNGVMDQLEREGLFQSPRLSSLEHVLDTALAACSGRVFADVWQVDTLPACPKCRAARMQRLTEMNRTQKVPPAVACDCDESRA